MDIQTIRQSYPQYNDMSDQQLADALYNKHYSDMDKSQYYQKIGIQEKPRREMDFSERMGENYQRRIKKMEESAQAYVGGEQSMAETVAQQGLQYAQLAPDIVTEGFVSGFRALPDFIEKPIREGASNVYSSVADTDIGRAAGSGISNVIGAYQDFAEEHPRAARNIGAIGNAGNIALALTPIKGGSATARAGEAGKQTLKTTGKIAAKTTNVAMKPLIKSGSWAAKKLDDAAEAVGVGISRNLSRADIPAPLQKLGDAELLFVKTLADEGVGFDDALQSLALAKQYKATPSVGVTANIPQMQTQGYLMSRGSAGSRVAAKAIKDIDEVQIPSLNKELIKRATGGQDLPAEQFGTVVSQEAKKLVDAKKMRLKTRAAPHYKQSVGVDKMVPIENAQMKKALGNRLVVKALDDFRADPYTLSSVADELVDLGIDAGDITNLPYNSTVSMHAARVSLRRAADEAFRSGDKVKYGAVKGAMRELDDAIESAFPSYKTARGIYSEDAGALKVLMESPVGKMSTFAEGNFSKIADDLAKKDPAYIRKFMNGIGDNQKMRDAVAGAYINRIREESRNQGRRFGDALFRSEGSAERLKALVGSKRFNQMQKVNEVLDSLVATRGIPSQSITAAAQSVKGDIAMPKDALSWIKNKVSPDLINLVQKDPAAAARYSELMFTDEGYRFLSKISGKTKEISPKDVDKMANFLNKNAQAVMESN